jgi:hypothetical protein
MLLPLLLCDTWMDLLQRANLSTSRQLRQVQRDTGLMGAYLRHEDVKNSKIEFDSLHETIVLQHAYLTNGIAEFVEGLVPALARIVGRLEDRLNGVAPGQVDKVCYDGIYVRQYLDLLSSRSEAETLHRQRMIKRIEVHLQVVGNFVPDECISF